MLAKNYLFLRLIRLSHPEEWFGDGEGLTFIFPKAGSGTYSSLSTVYPLLPGDVLAVNSAVRGTVTVSAPGDFVFWSFFISIGHLFPLFASTELCLLQNLADSFSIPKFYPASTHAAGECHRLLAEAPPQFNLDHRTHILRVASTVLSLEFNNAHAQRCGFVRVEEHLTQIFEKLSIDEILNLSVSELADRFSCSRRHLTRLFHHHFGLSVSTLRMEMRLLKAVSLLRDPDAKIINVAEQCNFNHLGLFNTCFKRRFGVSPGQWRKQGLNTGNRRAPALAGAPNCRLRRIGLCPWSGDSPRPKKIPAARVNYNGTNPGPAPPARAAARSLVPGSRTVSRPPSTVIANLPGPPVTHRSKSAARPPLAPRSMSNRPAMEDSLA